MPQRSNILALNEYYHLYSRGVDKRQIFLDESDEQRFIKLLYLCNGSKPLAFREIKNLPLVKIEKGDSCTAIGAYCLMPNHFHLLVKETKEGGVTQFMRKLLTAYSAYFNKKYERTGALFGSEFKSEHLNTDEYLKYIFSYIHLNPLKLKYGDWKDKLSAEEVAGFLSRYCRSSFLDYCGTEREESLILNKLAFPEYFPTVESFKSDIFSWFSYPQLP